MPVRADCDVAVVGAGPVGSAVALAAAAAGLRCLVLDAATGTPGDVRGLALSLSSVRILDALGLWPRLAASAEPIRRVHVGERGRFGALRIDAAELGEPALGYVVRADRIGACLRAALAERGCELLQPVRLVRLEPREREARLAYRGAGGEDVVTARLVVGADGADSRVRAELGIGVDARDYGQSAVIAAVTPERPHAGTAYERFTPQGPCALLPLDAARCVLVWTVPRDEALAVLGLDDERFAAAATERFGGRLGRFTAPGPRRAWPLRFLRARALNGPRAVLAGNAAHVVHPNAAQGLNLGLRDAAVLAELLGARASEGLDVGADDLTTAYAAARVRDHRRVIAFSDGLTRIFYNDLLPLALARSLALVAVDLLPPVKRAVARLAAGLAAPVPRLARALPAYRRSLDGAAHGPGRHGPGAGDAAS